MSPWLSRFGWGLAATGAAGLATLAYGALIEARRFTIRTERLPLLPPGATPFRILHISDLHLVPRDRHKAEWVHQLHQLSPDFIVNTGDNLGSAQSLPLLLESLDPLLDTPGVFVPGSNDFFGPTRSNPLRYFLSPSNHHHSTELSHDDAVPHDPARELLPFRDMFSEFTRRGWLNLTNTSHTITVHGTRIDLAGTHDAHLHLDRWPGFPVRSRTASTPDLRLAFTHAPYQHVLNTLTQAGADLIFAGHTHGGQICLPGFGALVTNCDLPVRFASGLHRWTASQHTSLVNISAGIGASPTVPVRIACRPEAVVIDLVPRET